MKFNHTAAERFLRYVQIDTTADPHSETSPSSEKQKNLSRLLVEELKTIGILDAETDEFGYVYATLPSNTIKPVPVICFCSHMDTSPDCSGENVKPIINQNYQGEDLILPDDRSIILKLSEHKDLKAAIIDLPLKEKDKLLLRLVAKDKVLTEHLHYKLLEDESDLDFRKEHIKREVESQIAELKTLNAKEATVKVRKQSGRANGRAVGLLDNDG